MSRSRMNRNGGQVVVRGYGAISVEEGKVVAEPPEAYPAHIGIHIIENGELASLWDYILVASQEEFEEWKKKAAMLYREVSEPSLEQVAKELYGEVGDVEVLKAGWQLGVKRYGRSRAVRGIVGYEEWPGYVGLSREKSLEINDWLWDMAFIQKTLDLNKLVEGVMSRFGLDKNQAEKIVRTEMANIFNKMREWAYLNETDVQKYRWVAKTDACEKCKEVEHLTSRGVSLELLKAIIREVGGEYSREWTVHPQCRCTFVRAKGAMREWERPK